LTLYVDANGRRYAVDVTHRDGAFLVSVDGRPREVDVKETGGVLSLLVGTKSYEIAVDGSTVHVDGMPVEVAVVSPRPSWGRAAAVHPSTALGASGGTSGPRRVTAPMPGKILKLLVKPGDRVEPRQGLVVVEAMKMENELRASAAGTVAEVRAIEGTTVEAGAILVILE
jgi:biotin carboxyl carrier protein